MGEAATEVKTLGITSLQWALPEVLLYNSPILSTQIPVWT